MRQPVMVVLTGLPASGKTTKAKKMQELHKDQYVRINRDDLRAMLHNSHFTRPNEKMIKEWRDSMIRVYLGNGQDIIIDDTNTDQKTVEHLFAIGKEMGATVEHVIVDVPLKTCFERNARREKPVPEEDMTRMAIRSPYLKATKCIARTPEYIPYDPNLPDCVIFDMDGTLSLMDFDVRNPFDYEKVGLDKPNAPVVAFLKQHAEAHPDTQIIIFSGRENIKGCLKITAEWLAQHEIPYDHLRLREAHNHEHDDDLKQRFWEEDVKGKYNALFWMDDRDSVVSRVRELGILCLQCSYGDF